MSSKVFPAAAKKVPSDEGAFACCPFGSLVKGMHEQTPLPKGSQATSSAQCAHWADEMGNDTAASFRALPEYRLHRFSLPRG